LKFGLNSFQVTQLFSVLVHITYIFKGKEGKVVKAYSF